jgi:hypothetical protein
MRSAARKWIFCVELLILSFTLSGQHSFPDLAEDAFGLNQDLVNGIQQANRYQRILGNPYFLEEGFELGLVLIDERRYPDVSLRYDLYAQKVLIEYEGAGGSVFSLVSVSERLREFHLGGFEFVRRTLSAEPDRYYQLISTDFFNTYVHWEKILLANNNSVYYSDHFSNPRLSYFLEMNGSVFPFHNRKSFAELFPEKWNREIRSLLRKRGIKFKNARAIEIVEAMTRMEEFIQSQEEP